MTKNWVRPGECGEGRKAEVPCDVKPFAGKSSAGGPGLVDVPRHAFPDELAEPDRVPIRGAHAAVALAAADRLRAVRAVDADAGFVEADPSDAHGVVRPGGEHVKILRADAVLEHALVPAEGGHGSDAEDFPGPRGRFEIAAAGRDRHRGDELF